jgi:cytosine/creatinine deaminase
MVDRLRPNDKQRVEFRQTIQTPEGKIEIGYNPISELRQMIGENGVNTHLHLDRAHTLSKQSFADSNIPLQAKWAYVDAIKRYSTSIQIFDRMAFATEEIVARGVHTISSFIDVDDAVKDKAMQAAQRLRQSFPNTQFVFQNQTLHGVISPEARRWFDLGAQFVDHIGGLPGRDAGHEEEHLDVVLGTAKTLGKKAFVHVDQNNKPTERETELLLRKTIEHGMEGRVVVIHGISLGAQTDEYLAWLLPQVAAARIQFITCPRAWIDSRRQGNTSSPTHTPITPVDLLLAHNITVAIGTDNTNDVYKPGAPSDIIPELELIYDCCRIHDLQALTTIATTNGLKVLGLEKL